MFSPYLFTHKYDIDDILAALCGEKPSWLNTQNGAVTADKPEAPESHSFRIEPLPASVITELAASPEQTHLTDSEKVHIQTLLASATIQSLPTLFEQGREGGWIRERIKDIALEWLDTHDLIPPSMRHINRNKASKLYETRTHNTKILIEEIN